MPLSKARMYPKRQQWRRIRPGDKIPLRLNARERNLIVEETFAPEELTARLGRVEGKEPVCRFTLAELDELAGYVAAEANHAKSKDLREDLDQIYNRIDDLLRRYTVEE